VLIRLHYYDRGGNYVGDGEYDSYMKKAQDVYREVENFNRAKILPNVEGGVWREGYIDVVIPSLGKRKMIFCNDF
jgi:hypothetical protein